MRKTKLLGEIAMDRNKIISDAEYADIIITLLQEPYSISSITKLVFISFCVKHENNLLSYKNRSKDFVDCFFKNISLKLSAHYNEIENILCVINMLKNTSTVTVEADNIALINNLNHNPENRFLNFCAKKIPNPILEINKLSTKALLEEVIRYV